MSEERAVVVTYGTEWARFTLNYDGTVDVDDSMCNSSMLRGPAAELVFEVMAERERNDMAAAIQNCATLMRKP